MKLKSSKARSWQSLRWLDAGLSNMTPEEVEAERHGQFHWNPNVTVDRGGDWTPQSRPPDYQKLIQTPKGGRR